MEMRDLILMLILTAIKGSSDVRSSLTFVIDDTGSMGDDIAQVKQSVNDIFDTVMNSNSSQIEDFIIVTFNDPGTYLREKTKDREAFKRALSRISVDGGEDCPELAMEGIEMALETSREGSLIYVYTDASAKDHDKYPRVEALSQKKRSQIVFILTGDCGSRHSKSYLVYPNLARATSGQVFHLEKHEIGQIMAYVTNTIENRKHVLTSKAFPPGNGNTFNVTVDEDTKELVIAVSGRNLAVAVTDSEGTRMPTEDITRLSEVLIVNVLGVKPDVYKVEVNSTTDTTVVVSGTTSVHFQHGFSVLEPTSLNDTATRPVPGLESYISIKLSSEGGNVLLSSVQILDMDERVLLENPLKMVDEGEQFYTTNETVELPTHMFKIAIKGYDIESNTYLTRISLTPIKPQDPLLEIISDKAPLISIDGGDKINATFNEPLQLKCQVTAYPKPDIVWVSDYTDTFNSSEPIAVELPYVYVSVLKIEKVKRNITFTCLATNILGEDSQSIAIETTIEFFNILEKPNDTTIEYHEPRQIRCEVDAMPPATVHWYKGLHPLIPDGNLEISANATILTINSMEPDLADDYICEVRNDLNRTVAPFRIDISGFEAPVINQDDNKVLAMRHSPASITCNVTEGEPAPTITWSYNNDYSPDFQELNETGATIHIEDADLDHAGLYKCLAKNAAGEDSLEIELAVEYPPVRTGVVKPRKNVKEGRRVTLHCPVSALPKPVIAWTRNGFELPRRHNVYSDGTLSFTATFSDEGNYECVAKNTHGQIRLRTYVYVIVPPTIETPAHSVMQVAVGKRIVLPCPADGSPKPDITWVFNSRDSTISPRNLMPSYDSGTLLVSITGANEDGFFTCKASNAGGSTNITYTIIVKTPPIIVDSVKQFTAVVGDWLLQIPCRASGNPKPVITWSKNGYNLASGTPWHVIVDDDGLKIRNIDTESAGTYVCTATNELGSDSENFTVEVGLNPDPGFLADVVKLEEGASKSIDCPITHQIIDRFRWFKDGDLLPDRPLNLNNVTENDAGLYTCRVISLAGVQTRSIKVEVLFKPKFITDAIRNINYGSENYASMDCGATGQPVPEVVWQKDGNKIDFTGFIYEFEMTSTNDMGRYTCVVSNTLGSIQRDFDISPQECVLDTASDFNGNDPLMLTQDWEFTNFENIDGYMHIPKDENIILACPRDGFEGIPRGDILVTCVNDKQFSYEDRVFSYAELKCRDKVKPTVSRTGRVCGRTLANSEEVRVSFAIGERFVDVYEVCLDKAKNKTLYTKQNIQPYLANTLPEYPIEWFNDGPPVDLDGLYDCEYQNNRMSSILRKDFHKRDGCCFAKRQLVDSRNVPSGLAQAATYTHLNVAPYWGTCNTKNWEEVEQRIRNLVRSADHELLVWSGTTQELELLDAYNGLQNIKLSDRGKPYQVAKYFWKVIQDPVSKSSLVIIQVNVPDLTLRLSNYILCRDVCLEASWMRYRRWRNPARGLTYCCSLQEFLAKFRVANVFHDYRKLLKTVSSLPSESSALHII